MSVGLDIGSKTIKIVELEKEGQTFGLSASGIVGHNGVLPASAKDDKELVALGDIIRKLHKEAHIKSHDVNISLPESLVFTRTIRFPLLTDQEIASAVKWEAEQYIPIPIADAIVEHQIIERSQGGPGGSGVIVLLVASPRLLVEKYIKLVSAAGLTTVGVETETLSLARSLAPETGVYLILDFGATSTDIAIIKNGAARFSRSVPTAGEAFTRALSQGLGVEYQQAEAYKKTYGFSSELEGKVKTALTPVFNIVSEEIKKAISFYQTEEKGEAPKSIIVSGGTAGMPEVISMLTSSLGIEVVVGNPFSKIKIDPQTLKGLESYASLYSVAVGLALRGD